MQRNLNRAVLAGLMARQSAVALESEEAPVVVPTESAADTTAAAVAAGAGEAGVPETAPVAETTAPTVIIKVEVEQASKPAGGDAPVVEVPPAAAEPVVEVVPEAAAEVPAADAGDAAAVAADAVPGAETPVDEVPPAESAEVPPAEGEAAAPAADAPAEGAPAEAGEVAADAPASAEVPAGEPAADAPVDAPVEGEAAADVPAADAAPAADAPPVDAEPTAAETDAAAAEVQTVIDESKAEGEEEGAAAAVSKEDLVVTSDTTPIGSSPEMITADQIAPELDEMATELSTYSEGGEALDKISDILESSAEEGGLPKSAAQILEVAVEHIHQSLKFKPPVGILAMEAFEQPGIRVSATSIALEEVAKSAKEAWESIKAGIAKFFAMVAGFYDKLASGALMQQKAAEGILKRLQGMGDVKASGTLQNPSLAKAFMLGTSVSKNVPQDLLTASKVLDGVWQHGGVLVDAIPKLINTATDREAAKQAIVQLITTNVAAVMKPNSGLSDLGVDDAPEGTQGYSTPPVLGNQVLWAYVPKSVEGLGRVAFGRTVVGVETSGDTLAILNTGEVKAVATIVLNTAKSMAALPELSRKLKAALTAFNTYASKSASEDAKPDPFLGKVLHQLAGGLTSNAVKLAFANNSAALNYCNKSLDALAPKKEAAPAAAPAAKAAA